MRTFLLGCVIGLATGLILGGVLFRAPPDDPVPMRPSPPEHVTGMPSPPEPVTPPAGAATTADRKPGPTPTPRARPGSLPDDSTESLLAELEAAARKGGPAPRKGGRLQRVVRALHGRRAEIPADLLALLLDHDDPFFRSMGATLLPLTKDPPWDRLYGLVGDSDAGVRDITARTAGRRALKRPEALRALVIALSDADPDVRRTATQVAARLADDRPAVRPGLVEALRDPDDDVRQAAESSVAHLGDAGARHALRALAAGRRSDEFVRAVVGGGLTAEAFELDLAPGTLAEFAEVLRDYAVEERISLDGLDLPYSRLLTAALQAGKRQAINAVFGLAIQAGNWEFVAGCARDVDLGDRNRRRAVTLLLEEESLTDRGIELVSELLLNRKTPQALRLGLVEDLGSNRLRERARPILRRVADLDPDPDVRAEARRELR